MTEANDAWSPGPGRYHGDMPMVTIPASTTLKVPGGLTMLVGLGGSDGQTGLIPANDLQSLPWYRTPGTEPLQQHHPPERIRKCPVPGDYVVLGNAVAHVGVVGGNLSTIPDSASVRFPLRWLQS